MRPLSEDETKVFFEKLSTYIGRNIKHLIDRPDEAEILKSHLKGDTHALHILTAQR